MMIGRSRFIQKKIVMRDSHFFNKSQRGGGRLFIDFKMAVADAIFNFKMGWVKIVLTNIKSLDMFR